jgi:hypothetical protein
MGSASGLNWLWADAMRGKGEKWKGGLNDKVERNQQGKKGGVMLGVYRVLGWSEPQQKLQVCQNRRAYCRELGKQVLGLRDQRGVSGHACAQARLERR